MELNKIIINGARALIGVGILVIALAIFINNYNQAALASAEARLSYYAKAYLEEYQADAPTPPVDMSRLLVQPIYPGDDASLDEKVNYEKMMEDYKRRVELEAEKYKEAYTQYLKQYREYEYNRLVMASKLQQEEPHIQKKRADLQKTINRKTYEVNIKDTTTIIRFMGTILLLLGAVGILLKGDNMEKLGVLILLGFAFKFVVGL